MTFATKTAFCPLLLPNYCFDFQPKSPSFRCRFSASTEQTALVSQLLLHKHHFTPQAAKQVSSSLSNFSNTQKADSVLSFLKEKGLSNTQLERLVTDWPLVLFASVENSIEPKLKIFQDLGLSDSEIAKIISNNPRLLRSSASKITSSLSIIKSLLGTNDRLAKVLRCHRRLFFWNLEETLLPNVEFLKTCGIPMAQITNRLYVSPNFLFSKPESMRNSVYKVDEMGIERTSKMFIYVVQIVSSLSSETWNLKLKTFKDLGFSEDDIRRLIRTSPFVFVLSEQKIKSVKEVLLETGKYDMSCIVSCPMSLAYSVEKRYKPRLQVLKVLEKRKMIEKWPKLSTLYTMSDRDFSQKFVDPYMKAVNETIMAENDVIYKT